VKPGRDTCSCLHPGDGVTRVPAFLSGYLQPGDALAEFGPTEFLIARNGDTRKSLLLHAAIGYAAQPKLCKNGEWLVRAEVSGATASPKVLLIAGDALRRYFYLLDRSVSLYDILGCPPDAGPDTLRMAWRVWNVELAGSVREAARAERAFNVLARIQATARADLPFRYPFGAAGTCRAAPPPHSRRGAADERSFRW